MILQYDEDWPKVKAVLVQHYPVHKEVEANMNFFNKLLNKYTEKDAIDIVVFPEMALTGLVFENKKEIEPFLEEWYKGRTFIFCSDLARRLKCWVILGYPQKFWNEKEQKYRYYNSAMIIDPLGDPHCSYKKHFLHDIDKTWCEKGDDDMGSVVTIDTKSGERIKVQIGIGNDINPYDEKDPEKCEFACKCIENEVNLIIILNNWIYEGVPDEVGKYLMDWLYRFKPFHDDKYKKKVRNRNVYILIANRTGKEKKRHFVGSSCALQINPEIRVVDNLSLTEENTLYVGLEL